MSARVRGFKKVDVTNKRTPFTEREIQNIQFNFKYITIIYEWIIKLIE